MSFEDEFIRFVLTIGIMTVVGVVVDFGVMGGWGLSPMALLWAWLSILAAVSIGYWIAFLIVERR